MKKKMNVKYIWIWEYSMLLSLTPNYKNQIASQTSCLFRENQINTTSI